MNKARTRRVVVVDNSPLARAVGRRIRSARQRAGMTQRALAGDRYTPAYISALEIGLSKPSMAALHYISQRLAVDIRTLVGEDAQATPRLSADLMLASGEYRQAADAYRALIDEAPAPDARAELLSSLAEALYRLDESRDALPAAAEAAATFRTLGRTADEAVASYWVAASQFELENLAEARALLQTILANIRAGLKVTADFGVRVLTALAKVESADGEPARALTYLEEARSQAGEMDDLRRARFLHSLAIGYQQSGDHEAALRVGLQSMALFRAADADRDEASVQNAMAMTYLHLGNLAAAGQALDAAMRLAGSNAQPRFAAYLAETAAQIALARGDRDLAEQHLARAEDLATASDNTGVLASAARTRARLLLQAGDTPSALASFARAAQMMRERGSRGGLREVLTEWADELTALGRAKEANELYREALDRAK